MQQITLKTSEIPSHLTKQKQCLPMKTKTPSKSNRYLHLRLPHSSKKHHLHEENKTEQKWLGTFTTAQREDKEMATDRRVQVTTKMDKHT